MKGANRNGWRPLPFLAFSAGLPPFAPHIGEMGELIAATTALPPQASGP
jgi:hypothetical protein